MRHIEFLLAVVVSIVVSACATKTGTAENHESVSLRFFIAGEGELAFCIAEPNPNPYQRDEPLKVLGFEEHEVQFLVFSFYDPVLYDYRGELTRLHLIVSLTDLSETSQGQPIAVSELWDYYKSLDQADASDKGLPPRHASPQVEDRGNWLWLKTDLVPHNHITDQKAYFRAPGLQYSTVIWDHFVLGVTMNFIGEEKQARAYLEDRVWIVEKVLHSLRVGEMPGEEVYASCEISG